MNITVIISTSDLKSSTVQSLTKEQSAIVLKAGRSYRGPAVYVMDKLIVALGFEKPKHLRPPRTKTKKKSTPVKVPVLGDPPPTLDP